MKCVTAEEMRRLDESAVRDYSIPSLLLMENAGRGVSDVICRQYKPCKVLIVVGKGNNGGDGLVVARRLANLGYQIKIVLLEDPSQLKADPLLNLNIVKKMKIPCVPMNELLSEEMMQELCCESALIVDAIFGTGLHSPVSGIIEKAIHVINGSKKPVLSIDIPSGLDSDSGQIHGVAVRATRTVTLALPKRGLCEGEGPRYAGNMEVVDIGIPRELLLPFLN